MIPGSSMGSPSASGRAGIRIRDCSLQDRESRSALALEWDSLAASGGAGITGDMTGIITESFLTTTPTSPTAESYQPQPLESCWWISWRWRFPWRRRLPRRRRPSLIQNNFPNATDDLEKRSHAHEHYEA